MNNRCILVVGEPVRMAYKEHAFVGCDCQYCEFVRQKKIIEQEKKDSKK